MRTALRLLGLMIAVVFAVGAAFVGARLWEISVDRQAMDRTLLYVRAFDEAVAREAGPSTAELFYAEGPVAPGGTGRPSIPCPLDQKVLRSQGPGRCHFSQLAHAELPDYCFLVPCVVISVSERDWSDPAVQRAAAAVRADPAAACRAFGGARSWFWRADKYIPGPVIDCGPWKALRGVVLLQVIRWDEAAGSMPRAPVIVRTVRLS